MSRAPALIALLYVVLLAGCTPAAKKTALETGRIRVFYNNDVSAYLETCGCRTSPIGGMDRRWNAMKSYPDSTRIFVDSGNLLFKSTQAPPYLAAQWYEQALGVIEAYNLLGADALQPGASDFALGLAKLEELAAKAKFPFVSANIHRRDGTLVFRESILLERLGHKVGVFGIFGKELPLPDGLQVRDPVAAAKRMVEKLKGEGAELIVALTHQGYDADVALARAVPGIQLIAGAHSQSLLQKPDVEGDALIVQLSNQGQVLGMVEYDTPEFPRTRTAFVVADLDDNFNDGPEGLANPMRNLVAVTNLRIAEANKRRDEKLSAELTGPAPAAVFETFLSCRDCHDSPARFQEAQPHAAAFLTLLAKHKETNLDCVKCHSVGLGQEGGFTSLGNAFLDGNGKPVKLEAVRKAAGKDFPKSNAQYRADAARTKTDVAHWIGALGKSGVKKAFVSVQCESCHGQLPGHPFGNFKPGKVSRELCLGCHTPEQAPGWYKDGKPDAGKLAAAFKSMSCPRKE